MRACTIWRRKESKNSLSGFGMPGVEVEESKEEEEEKEGD